MHGPAPARHPVPVRYSVDPAAVAALGRVWDGTADALRHARARVPEAVPAGPELARATAEFLSCLRESLAVAAEDASSTGDGLREAAVAYAEADGQGGGP